jgi:hypothetical protein
MAPAFSLSLFFTLFPVRLKQNSGEIHIRYSMRKQRLLLQGAWYEVRTAINNREPLFRRRQAIAVFRWVPFPPSPCNLLSCKELAVLIGCAQPYGKNGVINNDIIFPKPGDL